MLKRSIALILAATVIFMLSGCYFSSFSEEKANEAALSYLNDKYGEEFVAKEGGIRYDSIATNWYELTVVKKSEESEETQRKYTIFITTDRKYTVFGDTVMLDYYNSLYEDFAVPIIKKELGDIPFIFLANLGNIPKISMQGVAPDAEIPKSIDDDNNIIKNSEYEFKIFITDDYDIDMINDIRSKIKNSALKGFYRNSYLVILNDDDFKTLSTVKDKYQATQMWGCFLGKQDYILE